MYVGIKLSVPSNVVHCEHNQALVRDIPLKIDLDWDF